MLWPSTTTRNALVANTLLIQLKVMVVVYKALYGLILGQPTQRWLPNMKLKALPMSDLRREQGNNVSQSCSSCLWNTLLQKDRNSGFQKDGSKWYCSGEPLAVHVDKLDKKGDIIAISFTVCCGIYFLLDSVSTNRGLHGVSDIQML